jgi:hypothetical protein
VRVEQAVELARRFHAGATDKAGRPYLGHIQRVVDAVTTHDAKLAAALHDLLEDTPLTSTDLLAAGCPPRVIAAVEALTRKFAEDYEAFVRRAGGDPIAHEVKLADIADNADDARLALLEPDQAARLRTKYERARAILSSEHVPDPRPFSDYGKRNSQSSVSRRAETTPRQRFGARIAATLLERSA